MMNPCISVWVVFSLFFVFSSSYRVQFNVANLNTTNGGDAEGSFVIAVDPSWSPLAGKIGIETVLN
jgi:hypothetical protein